MRSGIVPVSFEVSEIENSVDVVSDFEIDGVLQEVPITTAEDVVAIKKMHMTIAMFCLSKLYFFL